MRSTSEHRRTERVALLEVDDLRTSFHTRNGVVRAVDGVSFCIDRGETLGIVGESGSGKSVACLSLLGLVPQPPGRIEGAGAVLEGIDLLRCPQEVLRGIRGRRVAMIFQDPMTSLNPYMTIEEQLMEPLLIHEKIGRAAAARMALQALQEVGVPEAEQRIRSYPHQFSGGMRQRVMIAMALIGKPDLLIADEPTTALDVTVQAQILDLIAQQQRQRGVAVIFISHDLSVVAGFCDRVMVMYAGRVVETAHTRTIFRAPKHPYTRALQRSRPAMQAKGAELCVIPGLPPDLSRPVPGCAFAPRCEFAVAECGRTEMRLQDVGAGQASACLRVQRGELTLQ
jgi:oligopeptide transport system ATP-binding protein